MEMGYKQTNNIIERATERRDAIFKRDFRRREGTEKEVREGRKRESFLLSLLCDKHSEASDETGLFASKSDSINHPQGLTVSESQRNIGITLIAQSKSL